MSKHALYFPALAIAAVGGATMAFGAIYPPVGFFVQPMTYFCAAATLMLFLRMLFDPRCHRGIEAANRELLGDQPFRAKWPKLNDPQWGLFGSRGGDKSLMFVSAVLFCEVVVAMPFSRVRPELLLLAAASLGVTMMLSLIHIGLSCSAADPSAG